MNIKERVILEKSIIYELISDPNSYLKVAGILSPKNFSVFEYEQIYRACQEIYPDAICFSSLITNARVNIDDLIKIDAPIDGKLVFNIKRSAFILLQQSVYEQFHKLVSKFLEDNENTEKRKDLLDIKQSVENLELDVFEIIKIVSDFFKDKPLFINEYEQVEAFNHAVVLKCNNIKSNVHIQELYYNLENLYQFDDSKKEVLRALSTITRYVMANEIPTTLSNKIINLSITL